MQLIAVIKTHNRYRPTRRTHTPIHRYSGSYRLRAFASISLKFLVLFIYPQVMSDTVVTAVCQMFAINTTLKHLCFGGDGIITAVQLHAMRRAAAGTQM